MRIEQKLSIILAIISLGNLVNGIYKKMGLSYYLWYVAIFFILIGLLLLVSKKITNKTVSISLLALAAIGVWFGGGSSLVSVTLFCISMGISRHRRTVIHICGAILIISILVKFTTDGYAATQTIVYLAGCAFIIILYLHYIHPKPPVINKIPGFSDDHMEILTGMITGKKPKEIADEMCLSDSTIRNKQAEMREKVNVSTNEQLIYHLSVGGYTQSIN